MTLTYLRPARKQINHVNDGVLYLHHFGTGFQELVFNNHAAARQFADANACAFKGPDA